MMGRYWIFSLYIIGIQFTNTNTQLSQKYSWATILYWFRFFDGAKILSYCIIWIYNKNNLHFVSNTAFNRRWNTDVGRRHPSIWFFLNKLRKAEVKCTLSVNHADNGQNPPLRKRKYRDLERRIRRLKRSYRRGQRILTQYWDAMTHVVATFH